MVPVTTVAPTVPPTARADRPADDRSAATTGAADDRHRRLGDARCRRRSCSARGIVVDARREPADEHHHPARAALRDAGQLGNAVVVHLGTNGPVSTETLDAFFGALAGVPKVVMLTAHADRSWIPPTNDLLYQVPTRFPNVVARRLGQPRRAVPRRLLLRRRHPHQPERPELLLPADLRRPRRSDSDDTWLR